MKTKRIEATFGRLLHILKLHWTYLLAFGIVIRLYFPTLEAEFGPIDDHIIPGFKPVIFEGNARFRPLFWAILSLERLVWGTDYAPFWHFGRIICAVFVLTFFYLSAIQWLRPYEAAVVVLSFFSGPQYWSWVELAAAEVQAHIFFAPGIYIISRQLRAGRIRPSELRWGYALILLSGLAKESFVLLFPVTFLSITIIGYYFFESKSRWTSGDIFTTTCLWTLNLFNLAMLLFLVKNYGHIHARAVAPQIWTEYPKIFMYLFVASWGVLPFAVSLFGLALQSVKARADDRLKIELLVWFVLLHVLFFTLHFSPSSPRGYIVLACALICVALTEIETRKIVLRLLGLCLLPSMIVLTHIAIYGSGVALSNRYYTPCNLSIMLIFGYGLYYTRIVFREQGSRATKLCLMVVCANLISSIAAQIPPIEQDYVAVTKSFNLYLARIRSKAELQANPTILVCGNGLNDEMVISLGTYLRRRVPRAQLFLVVTPLPVNFSHWAPREFVQARNLSMIEESTNGSSLYSPLGDISRANGTYIAVVIGQTGYGTRILCLDQIHMRALISHQNI